jgi:hypothetical protein
VVVTVVALILGILFTLRKLDVQKRQPEDFPGVDRADFERWKALEGGAYSLGSAACFLQIILDYAFRWWANRVTLEWTAVRIVGASIFTAWAIALIVAWLRGARGRKLREELGIRLREGAAQR